MSDLDNTLILKHLIGTVKSQVDLSTVRQEWLKIEKLVDERIFQKKILGRAISYYEKQWSIDKSYGDVMYGLCLAAYILGYDDLMERYQIKDVIQMHDELNESLPIEDRRV